MNVKSFEKISKLVFGCVFVAAGFMITMACVVIGATREPITVHSFALLFPYLGAVCFVLAWLLLKDLYK